CVAIMNPRTGGAFASFGGQPKFEVALERSLTELMQGRSFEGLSDLPPPTFNQFAIREPDNMVEHFIDSSGVVSWKFFGQAADYEFSDWNFEGSTEREYQYLMGILKDLDKEVYIADYEDLGANACRILVPGYSEIYPVADLVWDNTNKALDYREDILNLHVLDDDQLADLVEHLEESLIDDYTDIITLIGVEFDENTVWGQLTVLELKLLINLALGQHEEALERVEAFLQFNDNTVERNLFYRAVSAVLEIILDDELELDDYLRNLRRMYGDDTMDAVLGSVDGSVRFHGLTPTNTRLDGLEKHQRLIESYKKLHAARAARAGINLAG
ncbi:MAG: YcaO-like family protein, partial [Alcanivorax sp.]|nr:YcaO-like family protein [Alcanivorax sp.]